MRIGVIGWYGHNNAGDERMLFCLKRFFADDDVMPVNGFAGMKEHWDELNRCDLILFGGGGVILRGTGKHAKTFASLRPPLACVGISVESVHQDNIELLEVLKDKAEFILVRDEGSRKAFNYHAKVIVGPDITFLEPFEVAQITPEDRCGVNFLPWRYWQGEHNGRFDLMMHRINRRFSFIKEYYPLPKWKPAKVLAVLQENFEILSPVCLYNEPNRSSDADQLREFFSDIEEDFTPYQIAQCRMLVSMRLHSLIFACQMGIPFVSLSYMPKNQEFCKSIGMDEVSVNLFNLKQLEKVVRQVKENHNEFRERLLSVRAINYVEINKLMKRLTH